MDVPARETQVPARRAPKSPASMAWSGARVSMEAEAFKRSVCEHLLYSCARDLREATANDFYQAFSHTVRDRLVQRWLATQRTYLEREAKVACYLSSEFLTGRSLGLCLQNLGLHDAAEALASGQGLTLGQIVEAEGDAGLGNGGLGRLAACFMDSLATLELPAFGYGIRYEFGIFEQHIEDGRQIERRDGWLQHGNPWELPRHDDAQIVKFQGHTEMWRDDAGQLRVRWADARTVIGVPFDSFIIGHRTDNVNTLRLWAARATKDFDLSFFNEGDYRRAVEEKMDTENISKVLYPNDQTDEGKALRLKQQYFFVACSIADIVKRYKLRNQTFDRFPDRVAIQLNDTHPSIAVAELMRVLVDDEGMEWEKAWEITVATLAYTNHTLMPEALERWSVPLFAHLLPRHLQIIFEINHRFLRQVQTRWPGDDDRMRRMSIIDEGQVKQVRMANLATIGSHSINGVAKIHSDLVRRELLSDFDELWPERFNNKTNGVTPRRWLLTANPRLTELVSSRIGTAWIDRDLERLAELHRFADDEEFLTELGAVKQANKGDVARLVLRTTGIEIPSDAAFVVHVKRIHEYKRQILNVLQIVSHYAQLKRDPGADVQPRVYLFAGKAAAGYAMAKLHIKLVNDVAAVINADPAMRGRLAVAFIPNYGVSVAQAVIPAADLSVQISQAGTEASGTSNMKFALNGALTMGTLDGANVEIRDEVGPENFFLFGLETPEVRSLQRRGYDPRPFIERNPQLAEALALIGDGFFSLGERDRFAPVVDALTWRDPYMVCADFADYLSCHARVSALYAQPIEWARAALHNIVGARRFSSDNTIRQYASEIWRIQPVKADLTLGPPT